ncbi:MAG: hypothetical protein JW785_03980 [Acidimicrobiia bacterium]|nr:hypothetical protein [Acidimicrobiia bacterium]
MIRRSFNRAAAAWAARQRVSGEPRSANGASSFHLVWEIPPEPLRRVEATLEVVVPPAVPRLYFWALQVSFAAGPRLQGGAHLGLQWHPRYPGSTAVNFGGYGPAERGTRMLEGSTSELKGPRREPNTREFPWQLGHRYRLAVEAAPEAPEGLRAWRGTVEDLDGGGVQVVRDLYTRGEYLHSPLVWSEVFARCEHPTVVVRWSDLRAVAASGQELHPRHVRVNYQSRADGGCDNTSVGLDELGLLQITAVQREVPQEATLPVPGA